MRKKQKQAILLAAMVTLALQTGNALAAPQQITPDTYDEYQEFGGNTKDKQVQILEEGEYVFKNGATIVNSDKNGRPKDIISNNNNKDITITVGNEAEKTKLELISQGKPDDHSSPTSWRKVENNIITNKGGNTNINLTNTDLIFDGVYNAAVNADKINIQGDGNSNIYILGDMNTGLELTNVESGISNINGINDLKIISNKGGAVQALQLMWGNTLNLEVKNLQIGNINDVKTLNFGTGLYISSGNLKINADNINIGSVTDGIYAYGRNSNVDIDVNKEFNINAIDGSGIFMSMGANVDIEADSITINGIGPDKQVDGEALGQGIHNACGILNLKAKNDINIFGSALGIELGSIQNNAGDLIIPGEENWGKANIISEEGNINVISSQFVGLTAMVKGNQEFIRDANIIAKENIFISGADKGVFYEPGSRNLKIKSTDKNVNILSDNIGFWVTNLERTGSVGTKDRDVTVTKGELRGYVNIDALKGNVSIIGANSGLIVDNLEVKELKKINGHYDNKIFNEEGYFTTFNINADSVTINGNNDYGIKAQNILANYAETVETAETADRNSYVKINSNTDINIFGGKAGILSSLTRESFDVNNINNRKNTNLSSNINLMANGDISVQSNDYGIMAFENGNVNLHAKNGDVTVVSTDADVRKSSNIAAIYIESDDKTNSKVNIQSDNGRINILSNNKSVWVSGNGGELDVTGVVNINSKIYGNEEGQHIALVAGMKNSNTKDAFNKKGTVNINLTGDIDSFITGDVVGARNGIININRQSGDGRLVVKGDALAGNTGIVNLGVGNNGYFEGRTDDYQDAATKAKTGNTFFDPHFTDGEVTERGQVNLDFGKNSVWKVTGQSWASTVKSDNALIDLTTAKSDRNEAGHALTIETLEGNTNFKVHLDGQRSNSDMIYIKNASGTYNVFLDDVVTEEDIGETGLRFMTTDDTSSSLKVNRISASIGGLYNINYLEGHDEYQTSTENDIYNDTEMTDAKPGTDSVDDFLEVKKDKNNSSITLSKTKETKTPEKNIDATNHKIIAVKERIESDVVRGIEDSARVNYNMGILLDRLNKRLGEARYIDGDEGIWVRMWHKNTERDGQFETASNMYQIGYDKFKECDNGKHRQGVAIDYMDADSNFKDIIGNGEINRKGIWLYDTWLGDKGHYSDYVFKWGHLENKFGLLDRMSTKDINGEYNNNVFAISAEYGRKKMLNDEGWYIEPQAQLQYAYITGADYQTNLGTNVSMESVNSLIGRVGFRLGKDIDDDKKSTFYIKADILHEFMGDQEINAYDKTGILNKTYENEGTWYDIGIGFSTMLSDSSYAYLDYERCFGNDNDNTYQINGGVRWLL